MAFCFLADGEVEAGSLTYGELERQAGRCAARLRQELQPGERALLLYPPGLEFIPAFLGCLWAGVIAVPVHASRLNDRSASRLRSIARDAGPQAVLTTSALATGALRETVPELAEALWWATDGEPDSAASMPEFPLPALDEVAFLQYTSGSTSEPKGVLVTHGNLVHNEHMIGAAFAQDEDSLVVGWLPLFHDMGLIGQVLQPLWAGARCVLMAPAAFLQKPSRWLAAISRYSATTSGAPNFAYELCAAKVPANGLEGVDLSCWRVAFNGAEPVRDATLKRFTERFRPYGFRAEAFFPCYGLAEATLFVSGGEPGRGPCTLVVDAAALEQDEVVVAADTESTGTVRTLVSSGHSWMGQRIAIVDPQTREECATERVGEVWVAGPSVARGYWGQPEATERDFAACLNEDPAAGPFLRTGDLGFLRDGELYVTGRLKDLIILRGRNHYPQDLELTAEQSHSELRAGGGAAFSVDVEGEERLVIVHEVERNRRAAVEEIAAGVRRAIAEGHEIQVHEVVLIRLGSLARTTSGKVQRRACRAAYLSGDLKEVGRSPLSSAVGDTVLVPVDSELNPLDPRRDRLESFLCERAAVLLGAASISPVQPLSSLGLDSLSATQLKGELEAALGVPVPYDELLAGASARDVAGALTDRLATLAEAGAMSGEPEAVAATPPDGEPAPLSPGQQGLWLVDRVAPGEAALNIAVAARAHRLDPEAFARALAGVIARHESLRTLFVEQGGEPVQVALPELGPVFERIDASGWSAEEFARQLVAAAWTPFDLAAGPLLRVRLFEGTEGDPVLLFAVHHLVVDFWSLGLIARELGARLREESGGPAAALPPIEAAPRPADYARWLVRQLTRPREERLWSFWQPRLAGLPDLNLPTDHPHPPTQSWRGRAAARVLPAPLVERLQEIGSWRSATLYATLLAAFQAQLGRYSGQDAFAVGTPTAGRGRPELAGLVGYLVNPLPLGADLTGAPTFLELVDRVRDTVLAALEHGALPFPLMAARGGIGRGAARPPLYQAMFVFQRTRPEDDAGLAAFALGVEGVPIHLGGSVLTAMPLAERRVQVEVGLWAAVDAAGRLALMLETRADLFDAATAERMLDHAVQLLQGAAAAPETSVAHLPMLAPAERAQLLAEWGTGRPPAPRGQTLHQLFEEQADRTPEREAIVVDELRVTYRELERRANQLAHYLRRVGVEPEAKIAVCLNRSERMIEALLGVLKAGGAYVPLDPAYPAERLAVMLEDSGASLVITESGSEASLPAWGERLQRVSLDAEAERLAIESVRRPAAAVAPGHLAYLIYTSGSTGRPKAVAIEHRSPVARVDWARDEFAPDELSGVLAATSICFDLSIFEIFVPLAVGGRVIVAANALALPALPAAPEVTLINTVPSAMAELVRSGGLPAGIRTINLAGEPIPPALARAVLEQGLANRLWNLYGPSEDTTYSTGARLSPGGGTPIGRPLAGTRVRLIDRHGELVPPGAAGEVFLGGTGLARGYLHRPELTAERFVPDPFAGEPGARLYRTGDLGRYRPDGALEYLGRVDHQVKVRGFRIEPGEIAAVLLRHPQVRDAVVIAQRHEAGDRLVAYVVADSRAEPGPQGGELRSWVSAVLPDAMVPSAFVFLAALPLTPNGKLDRDALPRPALPERAAERLRTPIEELLAGIWESVLELSGPPGQVGPGDRFFDLGGHSLAASRVAARIREALGVDLPLRAVLEAPSLADLGRTVEAAQGRGEVTAEPPFDTEADSAPAPLSSGQERLWFLDRLAPGHPDYNILLALELRGGLRVPALAAALAGIVRRHDAFRTAFTLAGEAPVQWPEPAWEPQLPVVDLTALPTAAAEARRLACAEAEYPFDLAGGRLLRGLLLRCEPGVYLFLTVTHHIAFDGSHELFLRELAARYAEPGLVLPPVPRSAAIARWERGRLSGGLLARQLAYWRDRLVDETPLLELPFDRKRPAVRSGRGGNVRLAADAGLHSTLRDLARRQGSTLYMVLLAGLQALLYRYTGQSPVRIGAPVVLRPRRELENVIGCFTNTLVLSGEPAPDLTGKALIAASRETALGAFAHRDLPFEVLVRELHPERDLARMPLFQIMLALTSPLEAAGLTLPGLTVSFPWIPLARARFDLLLALVEGMEEGLAGTIEYDRELFDEPTMLRLAGHWHTVLASLAADPERTLADLPLLGEGEVHQLVRGWNDTAFSLPAEVDGFCVHELFEACAARAPEAPAVASATETWSYGELARRADRLAWRLVELGAGPDVPVGIYLERTPALVAGLLAVHKAGAFYVPLETSLPEERLRVMVEAAGVGHVITQRSLVERVAAWDGGRSRAVLAEEADEPGPAGAPPRRAGPDDPAYVIFTSGSTGTPKGVVVRHRPVVNLIDWVNRNFSVGAGDRALFVTSPGFDLSVYDVFGLLAAGGCVRIAAESELAEPQRLIEILCREPVTFWNSAPAALQRLEPFFAAQETAALSRLRLAFLSGDWIPVGLPDAVRRAFPGAVVVSLGGATEATVWSNVYPIAAVDPAWTSIPYGRPIQNALYYVLDGALRPCPIGVAGDLYIGGLCLSDGYAGQPAVTAAAFLPDPFDGNGGRLYRTGDRARFWTDGCLEFLGRRDQQVKIRGYRIELGEIEAVLATHPKVRESVAVVRVDGTGERRLVAYIVPASPAEPPAAADLATLARRHLAEAMVPWAFIVLDSLPLTANGKVDRKALPDPERGELTGVAGSAAAANMPLAEVLALLWAEVLGVATVGTGDDFFVLGGHSLLAARLVARVRETLGVELPLRDLFEAPTPAVLARRAEELLRGGIPPPPLERLPRPAEPPLSFAQERLLVLERMAPDNAAYHIAAALHLAGRLDVPALAASLGEIRRRHEVLRTRFAGEPPFQVVDPPTELPLPVVDLAGCPEAVRHGELARLAAAEAGRTFDLEHGPLLRAVLLRLDGEGHALLITLHHAVCDGPSVELLIRELSSLYTALRSGKAPDLAEAVLQYIDFALWQRQRLPEIEAAQLGYWRARLAGAPPLIELPVDRPRPRVTSFRGTSLAVPLTAAAVAVGSLAGRAGVTRFMVWLALFQIVLARASRQEDILIGVPFSNRGRAETADLIGLLVNTLVIRAHTPRDLSVRALLGRVREAAVGAYAHADLPFERVLEEVQPERSLSYHPLFQVLFALERSPEDLLRGVPGLDLRLLPSAVPAARLDLSLLVSETMGGATATAEYRTDLFDSTTIARLLGHLARLAEGAATEPDAPLGRLPLLSEEERRQLDSWSTTSPAEPEGEPVHRLIARRAAAAPDAPAIVCGEETLSYGELALRIRELAVRLRRQGAGPETRVGVCLERSTAAVVALLAVFETGATYVPLDPAYPVERLAFLGDDAGISLFVTDERSAERLPLAGRAALAFAAELATEEAELEGRVDPAPGLARDPAPDALAYLIYTSGSTGRPKGVAVEHGSLRRVLLGVLRELGFTAGDSIPAIASFSFDISLFEVLGPLLAGGTCHLLQERPLDLPHLLTLLEEVTFFHAVPALMRQVVETVRENGARGATRFGKLRTLLVGGDRVPPDLVEDLRRHFPAAQVRILYGPTEATIVCASCRVPAGPVERALIGRPLPGAVLHLWDEDLEPVPPGVAGEVCIGGAGVARGYWNRDDLTRERFVKKDGQRWYRTGDLARHLSDGTLEFLGRSDHQVKIRGFRVDPGEVETALTEDPAVQEAVVVAVDDGPSDLRLVAYVVATGGPELQGSRELELWPSIGEYFVYDELIYHGLTHDERRNEAYLRALARCAQGKVVVDIGTGRDAILSRLAIQAGAERVYAIELLEESYRHARRRIEELGLADRIFVLHGDALQVTLPEKADVCVSEIVEAIGGAEGAARILGAARRLLREGGVMIPSRSVTRIAAVSLPDSLRERPAFTEVAAHYVRKIFDQVGHPFDLRLCIKNFPPEHCLSTIGVFEDLDFLGTPAVEGELRLSLTVERPGCLDGFLLWLNLHLDAVEEIDILAEDYSWFPVYFPVFVPGLSVEEGDRIEAVCRTVLSSNGVHPHYILEGTVTGRGRAPVPFHFFSHRDEPLFRQTPFYEALFRDGAIPVLAARGAADLPFQLRDRLMERLPDFMIPSAIVVLEAFPLTAHGKVDRKALSRPGGRLKASATSMPPSTPLERELAGIWSEVLGISPIGIHDDFFALGGHSLSATRALAQIRRQLGRELPLRLFFEMRTVARVAGALAAGEGGDLPAPPPLTLALRTGPPPLSFAQERLWFLDRMDPGTSVYNVSGLFRIEGGLAAAALERGLDWVVRRHEPLRTRFAERGGEPVQVVDLPRPWRLSVVDLTGLPATAREPELRRVAASAAWSPFNLAASPLLRSLLLEAGEDGRQLLLATHHIVSDAWSMGVLMRDLAAVLDSKEELPPLPVQYADYAVWQRGWLTGPALAARLDYWRRQLAGVPPTLKLPTDRPRPAVQTFRGAFEPVELPAVISATVRELARREGGTPFLVYLTIFQTLLFRWTGETDFCIGSPVSGRNLWETQDLIGLFVNTLALRADFGGALAFREVLARTREVALAAQAHQDLPLEMLIADLQPQRDLSHAPLFQVLLGFHDAPRNLDLAGGRLVPLLLPAPTSKLDLSLLLSDADGVVEGGLEYNTDLFEAVTLRRIAGHWRNLLESALSSPERPITDLSLLSPPETHQIFVEWSAAAPAPGADALLHELFAAQARRTPDAVALVDGARRLTYADLRERSSLLARRLRGCGVGPEKRVAVCSQRNAELVVSLLAVLEAGGAYVPLDPAYPAERLAFTLEDSRASVLLTQSALRASLPEAGRLTLLLDGDAFASLDREASRTPLESGVLPGNLAYLIYTSGSTGRPKGVAIEHRSAVAFLGWVGRAFAEADLGGVLASTSICFDLSVFEIFAPLARGGAIILAEDALALPKLPAAGEVTLVNTVPSAAAELVRLRGLPPGAGIVNLAGEPLHRELVEALYATPGVRAVYNLYGPSEDTTYSTVAQIDRDDPRPPSIGRPIAGTCALVLDAALQPVPAGVTGELFLGGAGLARGYFDRPELTAERFIPDPTGPGGERLYRTGDLVRHRGDGSLEFRGRGDHQVKVRGFRIEMGEIEEALARHPALNEVVVEAAERESGELGLIAYVVPSTSETLSTAELRKHLAGILPNHMIPADFVILAEIPRTPNGKIDRRALPAPERGRTAAESGASRVRTPVEEIVADAWAEALGMAEVRSDDDFFELGGHSLLATRVISRLQERLGVELPLRALFQHSTVAALALEVEWKLAAGGGPSLPPIERLPRDGGPLPLSFAQERLLFFDRLNPGSSIYNISGVFLLLGRLAAAALAAGFEAVVRRHESLRARYVDGGQVILPPSALPLPRIDLRALPPGLRAAEAERHTTEEARRPFDLARGPLLRAVLLEMEEEHHLLAVTLHHIACDGWSLGLLIREALAVYAAGVEGQLPEVSALPELPVQYADFAAWQRTWLRGEALASQLAYWTQHLDGAPLYLDMPFDHPRPTQLRNRGGLHRFSVPPEGTAALKALGRSEGATLFMTLLTAWCLVLHRYSGQADIVVGSNIANRHRHSLEGLIGLLANTVALRVVLHGDPSVRELLAQVRETVLGAHAHQDLPFEKLVEALQPDRGAPYHPIFQVMLVMQDPLPELAGAGGLMLSPIAVEHGQAKFDLTLFAVEADGGIAAVLEYDADLFEPDTAADLADQLTALLEALPSHAREPISILPAVCVAHEESLLGAFTEDLEV